MFPPTLADWLYAAHKAERQQQVSDAGPVGRHRRPARRRKRGTQKVDGAQRIAQDAPTTDMGGAEWRLRGRYG